MEVIRYINGQPVDTIQPMKVINEGLIHILRGIQANANLAQKSANTSDHLEHDPKK